MSKQSIYIDTIQPSSEKLPYTIMIDLCQFLSMLSHSRKYGNTLQCSEKENIESLCEKKHIISTRYSIYQTSNIK